MIIWGLTAAYLIMMVLTGVAMYRYSDKPGCVRDTQRLYVVLKMITSALFLVIGFVAYNLSGCPLYLWLLPAYIFCFGGDLFLAIGHEIDNRLKNPQFIIGVFSFVIAQIVFAVGILRMLQWHVSWPLIIPFVVLGYTIFCTKSKDYEFGINAVPCCIYAFFVGLTGALGIQMLIDHPDNIIYCMIGVGAVAFLISDAVLSMKLFWKKPTPWAGAGVILFYFGAMWFLTAAIAMVM